MANWRLLLSALSYTATADSADSNFPATNLSVYSDIAKAWKATTSGAIVNVTLDFGSGNTFASLAADPGLFLDDLNVTSIRIQGNSVTTDWVTPPWDQAVTVSLDEWVRRYKCFLRLADLSGSAFSYRYLNIRIPAQSTTDGQVYRISRAFPGTVTELLNNPRYDSERSVLHEKEVTKQATGGSQVNLFGPRQFTFSVDRKLSAAAELSQELTILAVDPGQPFALWDSVLGGSHHAWLMQRIEESRMRQPYLNIHDGRWTFEEVV